jgi:hypothetical protein
MTNREARGAAIQQEGQAAAPGWANASSIAVVVGVIVTVLWPVLTRWGALAHRDLLFLPRVPWPNSMFWMGPDVGRRLPGFIPLAAASKVFGGLFTGRLMLVASAGALAWGMVRLVRRSVMGDAGSIITAVAPTLAGVLAQLR